MVPDWHIACAGTRARAYIRCTPPPHRCLYYADTDIVMGRGRR